MNEPTCPPYGQNTKGFVKLTNAGNRPVVIEYVTPHKMLYCRDIETQALYNIPSSSFKPMPYIPSRYREYVFQSVERYWAEAFVAYPAAVIITPSGNSPETFARKMRESRVAKNLYKWPATLFDEAEWTRLSELMLITPLKDGRIQIGPIEAKSVRVGSTEIKATSAVYVEFKTQAAIEQFCSLASNGCFSKGVSFIVKPLTPEQVSDLEQRYDVGFTPREDGSSWDVIFSSK